MDTSELLRRAWEAVEQSGVPEPLREAAFRAAVEDLRAQAGGGTFSDTQGGEGTSGRSGKGSAKPKPRAKANAKALSKETPGTDIDEDTFYANLAHQSGASEADLRDVLSLSGGKVHVTQPQRKLGSTRATQARTIISLVAPARAFGLGERPISAAAVRDEVKRLHAYDQANYSSSHLRELEGVNPGGNAAELVLTSKWPGEFAAALNQALGRIEDAS